MDLGQVLNQESLSLVHFAGHGSAQNHACIYCRRSQMACDLERPCTRCIKRNIGHLCHDELPDTTVKESKSVQTTPIAQNNVTSPLSPNLKSCHYTISRDHTEEAEDQTSKILADFGRRHIRTWTNLSLANISRSTADHDASVEGHEPWDRPSVHTAHGEVPYIQPFQAEEPLPMDSSTNLKTAVQILNQAKRKTSGSRRNSNDSDENIFRQWKD